MLKNFMILLVILNFGSCKIREEKLQGKYVSNYGDTLILENNYQFNIISFPDSISKPINTTGKWSINNNSLSFKIYTGNKSFWECHSLKIKRRYLKRPLHCEITHRFLIFKKLN